MGQASSESLLEDDYSSGVEHKSILSKMLFKDNDKKILRFSDGDAATRPSRSPFSKRAALANAACANSALHHVYVADAHPPSTFGPRTPHARAGIRVAARP